MKIEEAIQQKKFQNEYQKAHINLLYTHAWLQLRTVHVLKPINISPQQFNILRILRGQYPKPASIRELTDRMIDKASNASRLVDKLLAKGYVTKSACEADNRRMEVKITDEGLKFLEKASKKVDAFTKGVFKSLSEDEARQLSDLLDKIRD